MQCNAVLLLQFFFSSSVVFLLVINYELPKQVMRGRLKEKWLFSRLFWFLCLLNHVWEGEVSNRWNEPPYHLLRHQREPPCAEPTMFCSTQPNTLGQNLQQDILAQRMPAALITIRPHLNGLVSVLSYGLSVMSVKIS